ncbi:hypothetical protein [Streptomyces sp. NBC_01754]|uniref:hypothetical protein n=1 Tax=Streptomyces sp. NBC_01754 TaxID=2975930 RepID=UPI002DDA2038|nr:hypothetical protein [Streptomyces sp. NBC_01754]
MEITPLVLAAALALALALTGCSGPDAPERNLDDPAKKDIAVRLVPGAESSTLGWKARYGYIEDIGAMRAVVRRYAEAEP